MRNSGEEMIEMAKADQLEVEDSSGNLMVVDEMPNSVFRYVFFALCSIFKILSLKCLLLPLAK